MSTIFSPPIAPSSRTAHADPVALVLEPVLASLGFELVATEWAGQAPARRVLRVYVDAPNGISLDDCTRLSPVIGNTLDAAEGDVPGCAPLLASGYVLEVSSPGLDRPLVKRSHFERFLGRRAKMQLSRPIDPSGSQRTYHGVLRGVAADPDFPDDDRAGVVDLEPLEGGEIIRLRLADLRRANLVYEG